MSVLQMLDEKNVFSIEWDEEKRKWRIVEECDRYYDVHLNRQQMLRLAHEIIALTEKVSRLTAPSH